MKKRVFVILIQLILCGFASASDMCISAILVSGNKQTKEFTILRELPFRAGDVLPEDKLIESLHIATNHLNNTALFNYVYIDYIPDTLNRSDCESVIITISVEERWYYWPQVSLKLEDRNLSTWLHDKNFDRITIGWGMRIYNVLGMRHKLTMSHYFGFEKGLRIGYYNIALDKARTQMLGFTGALLYNHTINAGAENNKVIYLHSANGYIDRTIDFAVNYTYRPGIRSVHSFNLGYKRSHLGDSVLKYNPAYWGTAEPINGTVRFVYDYTFEHRDYAAYPTDGWFAGGTLTALAADRFCFRYGELNLRMQYYKQLLPRWFWGSRINTGLSFKNKPAYLYDQHVGYEEKNITGYDYYVVDGQHHAILNNDLRFCILPKRVFIFGSSADGSKFRKIHFTIYARLSYDLGYVYNDNPAAGDRLSNRLLWGSGLGIDLLTYYDIVLNCSYAINRMGEGGFYFGIKAPLF